MDPNAGSLVKAIFAARYAKPMVVSDPRMDILIDVGVLIGEGTGRNLTAKIVLDKTVGADYVQYSVYDEDVVVFDALYREDTLELGEYLTGPWEKVVSQRAEVARRVTA